jgi:uncharacterized protein (TIGR02117 family)
VAEAMIRAVRLFVAVVLIVVLAIISGTLVPRPFLAEGGAGAPEHHILLLSNPIHTDIAVPIGPALRERFAFLERAGVPVSHPDARWLIFGWGGRAFYLETPTWADLKPLPVLKALTLDRSVMHIDIAGEIAEPHPAVTGLEIGDSSFERLVDFIAASFEKSGGEPVLIAGAAYGISDRFYEALGSFNALVGCNTWTAAALREAGLQTGWWNPIPATLSLSLQLHN